MSRQFHRVIIAGGLMIGLCGPAFAASNLNLSKSNVNRQQLSTPPAGIHDQWGTKAKAPVKDPEAATKPPCPYPPGCQDAKPATK